SDRAQWCSMQRASCPLICKSNGRAKAITNTCDSKTLNWECICSGDYRPDAEKYTQTVPYFLCMHTLNSCVAKCESVESCVEGCRTTNQCGATNPDLNNGTTTSNNETTTKPTTTPKPDVNATY
ncbi:hypothetical protein SYNPS1DRAFT_4921, partial [Syncephalis pseudoplumigaleata]